MEGERSGKRCRSRSVEESSSSSSLPEELVEGEILTRLPGRSLARFESVNKRWRSLISSPALRRLCERRGGGLVEPEWSIEKLAGHLLDLEKKGIELLVPAWEGLSVEEWIERTWGPGEATTEQHVVLLQPDESMVVSALGPSPDCGFYLLAAAVKKQRLLHIHSHYEYEPAGAHYYLLMSGRLALFNPGSGATELTSPFPPEIRDPLFSKVAPWNTCSVHLGFGSAKVAVLIQYGGGRQQQQPEQARRLESLIYSFADRRWSSNKSPAAAGSSIAKIFDSKQSLLKGKWHWMALLSNNWYGMLSLDLGSEEYRLMGGPPAGHCDPSEYRVVSEEEAEVCVLRERLTVVHMARVQQLYPILGVYITKVDVFAMMEYGVQDSWVKLYSVQPTPPRPTNCCDTAVTLVGLDYASHTDSFRGLYFATQFKSCIFRLDNNHGYKVVRKVDRAKHSCWNFYAHSVFNN